MPANQAKVSASDFNAAIEDLKNGLDTLYTKLNKKIDDECGAIKDIVIKRLQDENTLLRWFEPIISFLQNYLPEP